MTFDQAFLKLLGHEGGSEFPAACDFCKHFSSNAGDDGWCHLHNREELPASGCGDYHCKRAKDSQP
jgi:hypothetical protein